jgi:HEAT repeat protein
VIDLGTKLVPDSDGAKKLKVLIETNLAAKRILSELRKPVDKNTEWWAWLAAMRPHPMLVPALIQLAQDRKCPTMKVVFALGQSRDSRVVPTLLRILAASEDDEDCCAAADALAKIGDSAGESGLIKALEHGEWRVRVAACDALAKIGSVRSLPALRKHVTEQDYPMHPNTVEATRKAIKAIEERARHQPRRTEGAL